jgi:MFS family permease
MRLSSRPRLVAHWLVRQRAFLATTIFFYINGAMWPSIASRIPAIASDNHLSPDLLGLALLGQAVGLASSMIGGGRLVDRWGPRRVALVSGIAYCGATALPGWAPNALTLFGALVFWGVANAPLDAAQNVLAASLPKPERGSIMARLELGFSAGMLSGAGLGAVLAGWLSPQIHLTIVAGAGIILVLGATLLLPKNLVLAESEDDEHAEPQSGSRGRHSRVRRRHGRSRSPLARLGYRRPLGRLAVLAMVGLWLEAIVPDWSGLFVEHHLGVGPHLYGLTNVCFFVALTAVQIPAATVLPQHRQVVAIRASGVCFAIGMAIATIGGSFVVALVGFALCGAGAAIIQPFAMEAAMRIFGGSGATVARVQTPAYFGLALEKPVTGFVAGSFGYVRALQTTIVLGLLVTGLGFSIPNPRPDADRVPGEHD